MESSYMPADFTKKLLFLLLESIDVILNGVGV